MRPGWNIRGLALLFLGPFRPGRLREIRREVFPVPARKPVSLSLLPGMRTASGLGLRFLWSGTPSRLQVLQQVRDTGGDGSVNTTALRITRVLHAKAPRR